MNKQITGQKAKQGQNGKSGSNSNLSPNKRVTRQSQKMARRQEEQQKREAAQRRAKQRRRITVISLAAVVVLAIGLTGYFIANAHSSQNGQSSLNIQETPVNPNYPAVDGIYCDTLEQQAYHIHAHVSIYINGQLSLIPQYTGIAPDGSCFYWLHTHNTDGVIHIEAPAKTTPTFGNFLDIWDSHFSSLGSGYPIQLADPTNWKVWVDGKPYTGNFRNIALSAHELITLAYNSPDVKPDTTYAWNGL